MESSVCRRDTSIDILLIKNGQTCFIYSIVELRNIHLQVELWSDSDLIWTGPRCGSDLKTIRWLIKRALQTPTLFPNFSDLSEAILRDNECGGITEPESLSKINRKVQVFEKNRVIVKNVRASHATSYHVLQWRNFNSQYNYRSFCLRTSLRIGIDAQSWRRALRFDCEKLKIKWEMELNIATSNSSSCSILLFFDIFF